jgi:hypothetical protein
LDPDEVKITMKISSLLKLRIIDHELCVCEYGLRVEIMIGFVDNFFMYKCILREEGTANESILKAKKTKI